MAVSAANLGRVLAFLHTWGDASGPDAFCKPMLRDLGELIPADLVEYFEIRQADRGEVAYSASDREEAPPGMDEAFARYRHQNPISAFRWTPADGPQRLRAQRSRRSLERLEYYREVCRPLGIRDQLKVWLLRSDVTAVCVTLNRAGRSFEATEASILEVLQPHLAYLHRNRSRERAPVGEVPLTRREAQVLSCVTTGRTTAETAELLFMSPATVRKHLENAYAKLQVRNRSETIGRLMRSRRR